MVYELAPIIAGFVARVLERGEAPSELQTIIPQFMKDREKRIGKAFKARRSQS